MIIFRTEVFYVPPSPLGLVGNRWVVEHRCTICHEHVPGEQLLLHAQRHPNAKSVTNDDA